MANPSQIIWIGIAHVKKVGKASKVGNFEGAEIYIAIRADSEEEYRHKVIAVFGMNKFQVISLNYVENEFDVPKDPEDPQASEKIELFQKLARGKLFAWGNFYPFGDYHFHLNKEEEE
jgi:hypothetical protein